MELKQETNQPVKKENTLTDLDIIAGIEHIYTIDQLQFLHKNTQPFYKIPSIEQINDLPNKGLVIRRYEQTSFVIVFNLVQRDQQGKHRQQELTTNIITVLIHWFARFANLVCQVSFRQDWYYEQLISILQCYKETKQQNSFELLSEISYCILNIQNPRLVQDLIQMFKYMINQECQQVINS